MGSGRRPLPAGYGLPEGEDLKEEGRVSQAEPRVGQLYSCAQQSEMHGGDRRSIMPTSRGEVTLIRFRPDINPNGPLIIEHGDQRTLERRVEMLRAQSDQGEALPVYKRVGSGAWEYLGRYRVQNVTDDAREVAQRSEVCGTAIRYVIRLEEAR